MQADPPFGFVTLPVIVAVPAGSGVFGASTAAGRLVAGPYAFADVGAAALKRAA